MTSENDEEGMTEHSSGFYCRWPGSLFQKGRSSSIAGMSRNALPALHMSNWWISHVTAASA